MIAKILVTVCCLLTLSIALLNTAGGLNQVRLIVTAGYVILSGEAFYFQSAIYFKYVLLFWKVIAPDEYLRTCDVCFLALGNLTCTMNFEC